VSGTDTKKDIFVLWEYLDLLEKEGEDLREQVDAIGSVLVRYIAEAMLDVKQYPETLAAVANLAVILEARATRMEKLEPRRREIMSAMREVLMELTSRDGRISVAKDPLRDIRSDGPS